MYKIFNLLLFIIILNFSLYTYKYYSSDKNLKVKKFNRNNINQIINEKVSKLPILQNDTSNVIEFNNSLSNDMQIEKPRSFWNLLKSK